LRILTWAPIVGWVWHASSGSPGDPARGRLRSSGRSRRSSGISSSSPRTTTTGPQSTSTTPTSTLSILITRRHSTRTSSSSTSSFCGTVGASACPSTISCITGGKRRPFPSTRGKLVILEGIMVFFEPRVRDLVDLKIFVDTPDDIRFIRRLSRDIHERGRTVQSVIDQYMETVRPGTLRVHRANKDVRRSDRSRGRSERESPGGARLVYARHPRLIFRTDRSRWRSLPSGRAPRRETRTAATGSSTSATSGRPPS
jgi:hypothetical protein